MEIECLVYLFEVGDFGKLHRCYCGFVDELAWKNEFFWYVDVMLLLEIGLLKLDI